MFKAQQIVWDRQQWNKPWKMVCPLSFWFVRVYPLLQNFPYTRFLIVTYEGFIHGWEAISSSSGRASWRPKKKCLQQLAAKLAQPSLIDLFGPHAHIFQQDGVGMHKSNLVIDFLPGCILPVLPEWPDQSPNLHMFTPKFMPKISRFVFYIFAHSLVQIELATLYTISIPF